MCLSSWFLRFACLLLCLTIRSVGAAQWAVIVAGSNGYVNYRHQADACHAFHVVRQKGIPEENIILMAYDDIANHKENPFKGKIFNKPDKRGPGVNVYAGCNIDYRRKEVSPKNFINVLDGAGEGKVLSSTAEDEVFIFFSDHGAPGLIAFPNAELHKMQLQKALRRMHRAKMFKKLVIYLETCESGSMFVNMRIPGVYAVSASGTDESSWAAYCDDDVVNGTELNTCLGDLFSVAWMEDSDASDTTTESLEEQFRRVKARTNKSNVTQWGDTSFVSDSVSDFLGGDLGVGPFPSAAEADAAAAAGYARGPVSARRVDLQRLYKMYTAAETTGERLEAAQRLHAELARQRAVEVAYLRLAELAYPGDVVAQERLQQLREPPDQPECELAGHAAIRESCAGQFDANSGFALQFHQVMVNICAAVARGLNFDVVSGGRAACAASASSGGSLASPDAEAIEALV